MSELERTTKIQKLIQAREQEFKEGEIIITASYSFLGDEEGFLLSLVPHDVDLQSLETRMNDGGLLFKNGSNYTGDWRGCRCEFLTFEEIENFLREQLS